MTKRKAPAVTIGGEERAARLVALDGLLQKLPPLVAAASDMKAKLRLETKIARGDIKAKEDEIAELVSEIESTLYIERPDFDRNVMERVRVDTGEVVSTRALTQGERQEWLALSDPDSPAPPLKADDDIEAELDKRYGKEGA